MIPPPRISQLLSVLLVCGVVSDVSARRRPRRPRKRIPAYQKILAEHRADKGSISVGSTSRGRLMRAALLPLKGKFHAVLARHRSRKTHYGTDELVKLIQFAAEKVARKLPSPKLMVGNLSHRSGGRLKWSVSHRAGRDGDVAYYLLRRNKPVQSPGFVKFSAHLRSMNRRGYTFDVRRNWLLVKALLTHPSIRVQWLFTAKHLRKTLLDYARKTREPQALVGRADRALKQPTDSLSHADHLHIRIYCSRQDRLAGCEDRAPFWPGVKTHDAAVARRIRALLPGLKDPDAANRETVLDLLLRLRSSFAATAVARNCLTDPSPAVRRKALEALWRWRSRSPAVVDRITAMIRQPGSGVVQGDPGFEQTASSRDTTRTSQHLHLAYRVLAELSTARAVPFLRRALRSRRTLTACRACKTREQRLPTPEPLLAARAARHLMDLRLVPACLEALGHPMGTVRHAAARLLHRLTNHSFGVRWWRPLTARQRQRFARQWQSWWQKNQRRGREQLVVRGLRRARRSLRRRSLQHRQSLFALIQLTRRPDHLGYNADRLLRRLTGHALPRDLPSARSRYQRWRKWYRRRYARRRTRTRRRRRPRKRRRRLLIAGRRTRQRTLLRLQSRRKRYRGRIRRNKRRRPR